MSANTVKTKKGRMILIDGMSGAGKSTTAQKLARQFGLHFIPFRWMHEEIAAHPIRDGEFTMGDTKTLEGMEINVREMLKRWRDLTDTVVKSGQFYLIEGCFLQSILRYFAGSAYTAEQTIEFCSCVSEILTNADTLFVYLRSPNAKATYEYVYPIRGQWWKDLVLTPEEKFFHITEYNGNETIYETLNLYREISDKVFTDYTGDKLMIEASVGSWQDHPRKILEYIGLPYIDIPSIDIKKPDIYCGKYNAVIDGEKSEIEIKYDTTHKTLFAVGFWPYMKLTPISYNAFEMESFPIVFSFTKKENERAIIVTGEYDWNIFGNTLKVV